LSVVYLFDLSIRAAISALAPAIAVFVATQCQATASGRDAYGAATPYFQRQGGNADRSQPPIPKEILMRIPALAILTIGMVFASAPARAQTYSPDYPVCLHVYGPVTYYECSYTSIPQCNQSASGRSAQCVVNPYAAYQDRPVRKRGVY
jgi:hypothetical protein